MKNILGLILIAPFLLSIAAFITKGLLSKDSETRIVAMFSLASILAVAGLY